MNPIVAIGLTLIVAFLLFRAYRRWRIGRQVKAALDVDSLPEAGFAKVLAGARAQMPAEDYEKFENAIFKLVGDINTVNSSGLASKKERLEMLSRLSSGSSSGHQE